MASEVEIVNVALTLLGEGRISSLDENTKPAREAKALFEINRNSMLAGYNWSFAMARTTLPALADAPAWGYGLKYAFPPNALRLVQVDEFFYGADLTDYRNVATEHFTIEGREILTDIGAPLKVRYVNTITDTAKFQANFVKALGAYLAADLAEPLTNSRSKRELALGQLQREISLAIRANAIELPPQKLADDEWLLSRL
jgi:hypothetical protein